MGKHVYPRQWHEQLVYTRKNVRCLVGPAEPCPCPGKWQPTREKCQSCTSRSTALTKAKLALLQCSPKHRTCYLRCPNLASGPSRGARARVNRLHTCFPKGMQLSRSSRQGADRQTNFPERERCQLLQQGTLRCQVRWASLSTSARLPFSCSLSLSPPSLSGFSLAILVQKLAQKMHSILRDIFEYARINSRSKNHFSGFIFFC